ncbi:MAG TPA: RNA polymerase sporulation sigma factor SigK [Candidatus Anaerobutyricum stercoripullorum]|uniref:RNA polymerase sigma factor n=1 Tax=Candidatus Anaerobutyricum stercoripullorum TaxID=2838456 RepID=A0A9D1X318_9FIRM|nr:RNA polymerase sporulation sigma factor SigK [Candidatus Anaerobutyricum stercoripullorum]
MRSFKKPLKAEEERKYLKMYRDGDETARETLIEHNLRLVAHIVKKYNSQDRDLDDLISIGTIGLIKAVNTFDEKKGGRLVTYAARCIENELLMMLRQEKKLLREVSLYEPIGTDQEGNHISLMDIICTDEAAMIEQFIYKHYLGRLNEMVACLSDDREREIIIKRYGLDGGDPRTQKEVAAELGISRSYVSRIEKRALKKLKTYYEQQA